MSTLTPTLPNRSNPAGTPLRYAVLVISAGIATAIAPAGPAIAAFFVVVTLAIAAIRLCPEGDREPLLAAFSIALALRLLVMVLLFLWFRSPENPGGFLYPDSFGYDRLGIAISGLIKEGLPFRLAYHTTGTGLGYHQAIGYLYAAFGTSHWIGKVANCVLGAGSVLLTYAFARSLASRRVALMSAWMLALWPTAIYWSAQLLKDMLVAFLVILAATCWVRFVATHRWRYVLLYVLATVPLFPLRLYIFAFLALGLYVGLLVVALRRRWLVFAGGLLLAAVFGWSLPFTTGLVDSPAVMIWKLSQNDPTTAGSVVSMLAKSGAGFTVLLPLSLIKFMISPLPWNAAGRENLVVPGIIVQYMILPFAVRGGYLLLRDRFRFVLPVILLTVLTNLLYALVFFGANPRHMHMFYPFMFVCAAIGMERWRHWPLPWCLFFVVMILGGLAVLVLGPATR